MGISINSSAVGVNSLNKFEKSEKKKRSSTAKIASQMNINKAADDASGLAVSEKMKNQLQTLGAASENCEDGVNFVQTVEGYMAEMHEMSGRMTELAEKSANGTLDNTDRDSLQDEMDSLCAEIDRIATTASFNNYKLLDGSATNGNIKLQIGDSSTSADQLDIKIGNFHTDKLLADVEGYVNTSADSDNYKTTTVAHTMSNNSSKYKNGITINIKDQDSASAAADAIKNVTIKISKLRGEMGAYQNRLNHNISSMEKTVTNITKSTSDICDTDVAKEMTKYTSEDIISQASQSMLGQARVNSQDILSLLQ